MASTSASAANPNELARKLCGDLESASDIARTLTGYIRELADLDLQRDGECARHAAAAVARLTLAQPETRARIREELAGLIEEAAATALLIDFARRESLHRLLRTLVIHFLDNHELVPFEAQVVVADQLVRALVDASE